MARSENLPSSWVLDRNRSKKTGWKKRIYKHKDIPALHAETFESIDDYHVARLLNKDMIVWSRGGFSSRTQAMDALKKSMWERTQ